MSTLLSLREFLAMIRWMPRWSIAAALCVAPARSQPATSPVDFEMSHKLTQRTRDEDRADPAKKEYLNLARAVGAKQLRKGDAAPARVAAVVPRRGTQRPAPARLTPLTDFGPGERYEGEAGGLYGGGTNILPESHRKLGEVELAQINPRDRTGEPAEDGIIGFVSISMSNATQEFSHFKVIADRSTLKSPRVTIVDCAQGGQAMAEWAPPDAKPWEVARERLDAAGVTVQQVQVAWIKLANKAPTGSLEEHGRKLERDTLAVLHNARILFPNLRVAYLGSRTFAGYATELAAQRGIGLNPEPYAFESAFSARRLILRQIERDPALALTRVPLLLWGPYLWAEGQHGRKIDSLVWERSDFGPDGVHPSDSGRGKVSAQLLTFLTTNPLAKSWFTGK